MEAVRKFIEALQAWEEQGMVGHPEFDKELRVKDVEGSRYKGIWEMTWRWPNGRATFEYGEPRRQGKVHVIWRRVGTHRVFKNP